MKTFITVLVMMLVFASIFGIIGYFDMKSKEKDDDIVYRPSQVEIPQSQSYNMNTQKPNQSVISDDKETITIDYTWEDFNGKQWNLTFDVDSELYDEYKKESRKNRNDGVEYDLNYVKFVSDKRDDLILINAIEEIVEECRNNYYSDFDIAGVFLALAQTVEYKSDILTTGYQEYPKYPIETLIDGRGDCEDTAALLAQLLSCAEIRSVLIAYEDHMAVGVKCTPEINRGYSRCYYTVGGTRYYYAETTDPDWIIGEMPEEYFEQEATVMLYDPASAFMLYAEEIV